MTLKQYLASHHFTSTAAFDDYTSSVLKKKLAKVLGRPMEKGEVVDWDIDGLRTSPIDH